MFGLGDISVGEATTVAEAVTGLTGSLSLATALVVFARMVGFFVLAPFFGSMNIPMTVRVSMAAVLSIVAAPLVGTTAVAGVLKSGGGLGFSMLLVNQVLIGLLMGIVCGFVFYGIESAGRVIDTQRGSNISDTIAPQSGERTSPMGQWMMMLALVIFISTGQHLVMLEGIINSFTAFPPTTSLDWVGDPMKGTDSLVKLLADLSGQLLVITMQVAAPAMLSLMLTDVLLGIINRGAPQVNVFALSMVIKGPIGLAAVLMSLASIALFFTDVAFPMLLDEGGWLDSIIETMANPSK